MYVSIREHIIVIIPSQIVWGLAKIRGPVLPDPP